MNLISTTEAAGLKGISRQAIIDAIDRGDIDGQRLSARNMVVVANKKFETWKPSERHQDSGRARASAPKDKKSRRTA